MKSFKVYVLIVVLMLAYQSQGQRGLRVGYVDMEYILDQIPDYQQAVNQLDQKAQKMESRNFQEEKRN